MSDSHAIRIFVSALTGAFLKEKAEDAVLLPPSKDSVANLHGTQSLLRPTEGRLHKEDETVKMSVLRIRIL